MVDGWYIFVSPGGQEEVFIKSPCLMCNVQFCERQEN